MAPHQSIGVKQIFILNMTPTPYSLIYSKQAMKECAEQQALKDLHFHNFQPTLKALRQTDREADCFLSEVVMETGNKQLLDAHNISRFVTLPTPDPQGSQYIVSFIESNLVQIRNLNKPSDILWEKFALTVDNFDSSKFQKFQAVQKALSEQIFILSDSPVYGEVIIALSSGLGKAALPILNSLQEFSQSSELLACMSCNQTIALYVGTVTFVKVYYVLQQKGSFIALLDGVQQAIYQNNAKPLKHVVNSVIYNKEILICGSIFVGTVAFLKGDPAYIADTIFNLHIHFFDVVPRIHVNGTFKQFMYETVKSSGSAAKTLAKYFFKGFIDQLPKEFTIKK